MRLIRFALAGGLLIAAALPAAAQTQLTSRPQITSPTTLDWGGLGPTLSSPPNPFTLGVVSSGSTDGSFIVETAGSSWNGGFLPGENLLFAAGGTFIDLTFNTTLTAFGTQLWQDFPGEGTFTLDAFFNGGPSLATYTIAAAGGADANNGQAPFLGISDLAGFNEIRFTSNGNSQADEFAINQITYDAGVGTNVVPEPATMSLLAMGMVGMAGAARRRRRKA